MPFAPPPPAAAWHHRAARVGFEVAFFSPAEAGWQIDGFTTAVEGGETWSVGYAILLDRSWTTRQVRVSARSQAGACTRMLAADGAGHWTVDGRPAPHLDGCLDVDLESSAMTNALPVHRLDLAALQGASAPAAYLRAASLAVERLEQTYQRAADDGAGPRFEYAAPGLGFTALLEYDGSRLVVDYPGLARRVFGR